ncbi:MAG: S9 family peptidase, partial [Proteobacteria bacterium]|nr:S9 family peptidase [Pseudomonadota bacterium]
VVQSRDKMRQRVEELFNYERYGIPSKKAGKYFYSHNDGLQNQSILYVMDSLDGEGRMLLDPNTFSEDGTVSLKAYSVSEDGRYLAYGLSDGGSDWTTFHVRDIETGKDLDDELKWSKFSGASWTHDNVGFFYSRYDEPKDPLEQVNKGQKVYYHKVGTPQASDELIYERKDVPEMGFEADVTEDGAWLTLTIWQGSEEKSRFYYRGIADTEMVRLLDDFDAAYHFLGNKGNLFWFVTDLEAPRKRLIAIDITKPEREHWTEVIAETEETLQYTSLVGGKFACNYLKDARALVRIHELDGKVVREVDLPGIGDAGGFYGRSDDTETFYWFETFTSPYAIHRYDMGTGESALFKKSKVAFDPNDFEVEQVFYTSPDGTKVPMFIAHKKGITLDGTNPTILYGYGGFNIPLTPGFRVRNLAWMELGGVFASANTRGGGEYGRDWHEAGTLKRKQNVYDDFYAAAEYLVAEKYTSSEKLAINGGSNGGLLVGVAILQRPELFAAAIPEVGVLDMLRYHEFTIGWAWASDYGTSDDPDLFPTLHGYSPYHNVESGKKYPATMIMTGDHDDRVVPAHSFKFAAALQHGSADTSTVKNPALIR